MKKKRIYAIILNYNSADESIRLFKDLRNLHPNDLGILVIDNSSNPTERTKLEDKIPQKYLIFNSKNRGYAGGNNVGIEHALEKNAEYIWILNPDIRIENTSLLILKETLEKDKTLAAVGPRIIKRENPDTIFSDGELIDTSINFHTIHKNFNKKINSQSVILDYDIDYIDGSCILFNSQAIKKVGRISEDYFLYFEETDWCTRAKRLGWKLAVNRRALANNLTSEKKETYHYFYTRNKLLFSKKFDLNYESLKKREIKTIVNELRSRLKGEYLKPYFFSRLKGLIAGITQKI
ncbi:glycosyltransferase family 2 protein [Gramella sp. AN32]|uniref:Glycosyltransferase family 2 protein n=1 Tax=Christiangramia antarctica TaxID=2058158 RepID=A0ABW5X996_9FLAO|nr:glycosyltransferase family 2 protein [Gramella sp. AN32]MCM4154702.1 hypothetical protein [Gramella sp. AN32]